MRTARVWRGWRDFSRFDRTRIHAAGGSALILRRETLVPDRVRLPPRSSSIIVVVGFVDRSFYTTLWKANLWGYATYALPASQAVGDSHPD